jgi:hypothetical protein
MNIINFVAKDKLRINSASLTREILSQRSLISIKDKK